MSKLVKLGNAAKYSDKRIKLENVSLGNFITTDNLLQNKAGVTKATNLPPQSGGMPFYKAENILVGNIRPYLKKIWFADRDGGCSADVLVLDINKGYFPKYIYYALFRDDFFDHMMKGAKGTKMPRGDKNQILEFLIPDYDLLTQQKIAHILSTLDAKIELNNRINAELEAMAKTLYDYWFVQFEFPSPPAPDGGVNEGKPYKSSGGEMVWNEDLKREIPVGWEVVKMSSMYEFQYGYGNNNPDNGGIYPVYGSNGIIGYFDKFNNEDAPVIGHIGANCGSLLFASGKHYVTYNGVMCKIRDGFDKYFGYFALLSKDLKTKTRGSSQPFISYDMLNEIGVAIPNVGLNMIDYCKLINPLYDSIIIHKQENQQLSALRDWLLPMLMNGQVVVE